MPLNPLLPGSASVYLTYVFAQTPFGRLEGGRELVPGAGVARAGQ